MMALAHLANGPPTRSIHLFDSFQGLPEPDAELDGEMAVAYSEGRAHGRLVSIGACASSLDVNRELMERVVSYPPALTVYHVGWFQDTVPEAGRTMGPIALLRLDGDWYASTKLCLEHLFPLVVDGGAVVIDDYGKWAGCRRATEEFLAQFDPRPFLHIMDSSARYFFVQRAAAPRAGGGAAAAKDSGGQSPRGGPGA